MVNSPPVYCTTRRYPRVCLPSGMFVAWYGGGQHDVSRVGTLGLGGLFIFAPNPLTIGTSVRLAFEVPGGEVKTEAIVRNITPGEGMGVEFVKLGYRDRLLLHQLMKRLLQ